MRTQRGSVAVVMLAIVACSALIAVGLGRLGFVAIAARRAEHAADAAALAGADELALGGDCRSARVQALRFAAINGASLVQIVCDGSGVEVATRVGPVQRGARAEVEGCWWCRSAD